MTYTHPDKVAPVATITDTDRIEWLIRHCDYLEHHGRMVAGGYWPQEEDSDHGYADLSLRDYIDQRIKEAS